MNSSLTLVGKTGLQFFGTMTASISHEIKNVLAIINENAGLMKDLTLMAEQGRPLNLEKIKTLSDRFGQQVIRADKIVKSLNQFSHSIDDTIKEVDVGEAVSLVIALANRFIAMKNVSIDFQAPETAIYLHTNPFFFNNLLWFSLEFAMNFPGEDKTLTITCNNNDAQVHINFAGLSGLSRETGEISLFSTQGDAITDFLGAHIDVDEATNSFVVSLPHHVDKK